MRRAWKVAVGVALIAASAVGAGAAPAEPPAGELGRRIQGLVNEFKKEQQAADAALGAAFSREAIGLVEARLRVAEGQVTRELDELTDETNRLVEERFNGPEPASNSRRNQQLADAVLAAVAETTASLQGLDSSTRGQLQAQIAELGRAYVARRNKESASRVAAYLERLKALVRTQADQSAAQIRAAIRKAVADFRAKIAAAKAARPPRRARPKAR